MDIDDITLVNKCLSGDKTSFEHLVKRHSPRVFHIIYRFFNDKLLIEDIAQEVFINAYNSLYTYGQRSPFKNWLSKITVHICYRTLKIQKKRIENLESDLLPEELSNLSNYIAHHPNSSSLDPEKRAVLRDITDKILHHLSAKEKMILILSEVEGKTLNEISELMGLSTINVKVSKFRARKHAVKILKSLSS